MSPKVLDRIERVKGSLNNSLYETNCCADQDLKYFNTRSRDADHSVHLFQYLTSRGILAGRKKIMRMNKNLP